MSYEREGTPLTEASQMVKMEQPKVFNACMQEFKPGDTDKKHRCN